MALHYPVVPAAELGPTGVPHPRCGHLAPRLVLHAARQARWFSFLSLAILAAMAVFYDTAFIGHSTV